MKYECSHYGSFEVDADLTGEGDTIEPIAILNITTPFDLHPRDGFELPGVTVSVGEGATLETRSNLELTVDEVRVLVGQLLEAIRPLTDEDRQAELERRGPVASESDREA